MLRSVQFFFLLSLLIFINGCVGASTQPFLWQDETFDLVWPEPPDKPRIRYLRSLTGPLDFKENNQTAGFLNWLLGERQEDLPLLGPFAVATSRSGSVWVADNGARALYQLDLTRRKTNFFKEFAGTRLISPSGVAVDDERQRIFLSDAGHGRIFILDFEGNYIESWGPEKGFERLLSSCSSRTSIARTDFFGRGGTWRRNVTVRRLLRETVTDVFVDAYPDRVTSRS